jgi:GH25 family lysozyme M1 (1,4-beta-N-acetylmuramidase)
MRGGGYIFFHASRDPSQANTLLNNASLSTGDLILAVDFDVTDGQSEVTITARLQAFLTRIHDVLGAHPLLLTTKTLWDDVVIINTVLADQAFPL